MKLPLRHPAKTGDAPAAGESALIGRRILQDRPAKLPQEGGEVR